MQTLASPQATLIKRELLRIPLWGWAFSLVRPSPSTVAIHAPPCGNSSSRARDRLRRGMYITLFPEGTRMPPGTAGKFHRGGAALAAATGRPVVVVAHNAGQHWPRGFKKMPGTITAEVSEPFDTKGFKSSEINEICESWLNAAMARLERDRSD